jgi:APA family basic amino acid/polyamine antiporter
MDDRTTDDPGDKPVHVTDALPHPHEGPSVSEPAPPQFLQKLGLFDAIMLVAGTMIGSGIFIVSADVARDVGSSGWLMLLWLVTGAMTLAGALCYAELAAAMPQAGGQYVFLREAYSPLWGFLYGWTCFLVIQTGSIAAVGVAFAKFLGVLVPALGTDNIVYQVRDVNLTLYLQLPWLAEPLKVYDLTDFTISAGQLVAVVVVALLTLVNCRGVEEGKWVQNTFTLAKTVALVLLIVLGLTVAANPAAIAANWNNLWAGAEHTHRYQETVKVVGQGGLLVVLLVATGAMTQTLFAADAWNNVTFTAGEIINPRRNLPRSLIYGTGLVIVLYLLANLAYLAVLPVQGDPKLAEELASQMEKANQVDDPQLRAALRQAVEERYARSTHELGISNARDDRVGTAVLQAASPRLGVPFMAIAIMISTFGCVNGMILMGARLYYAMARDGLFFHAVGRLNRRHVPGAGLILQGVWSILLIFSGTYNNLLDFVMFAVLLFYALTVVGLYVLRVRRPELDRPYKVFGYPLMPAIYVVLCTVIMLDVLVVKPEFTWPGLIIVLAGIPVYFLWRLSTGGAVRVETAAAGPPRDPG